jgi:putative glutamine amidotransferase
MEDQNIGTVYVGIVGYHLTSEENSRGLVKGLPRQEFSLFSYDISWSVINAGGIPQGLPVIPKQYIKKQLAAMDALIFSGGEDVHPKFYGENIEKCKDTSLVRDQYEFEVLKEALDMQLPILFICRGMQLLNIYQGGTLYTDLNQVPTSVYNHVVINNRSQACHSVKLKENHFISEILGDPIVNVNSIHHQVINKLGEDLEVVGTSEDGIIEALAMKGRKELLAVQWHPEMMTRIDEKSLKLFTWLIDQVKNNKGAIK